MAELVYKYSPVNQIRIYLRNADSIGKIISGRVYYEVSVNGSVAQHG